MIRTEEPLEVAAIHDRFTLRELLERSAQDASFIGAYLYYFGMVTLGGETSRRTWLLEIPNEVVRGLYIARTHHRRPARIRRVADRLPRKSSRLNPPTLSRAARRFANR